MTSGQMSSLKWLKDEDALCFEDRRTRLNWLVKNSPIAEYWLFPGGLMAKSLFEEARYCFVYGQFIATSLLGLAYIERTLSALFFEAGRNDLKRASLSNLLNEALDCGLINREEFRDLERIRKKRNSFAHFRKPGHKEGIEHRSIVEGEAPYNVIEQDAFGVISATLRMVAKASI